MNNDKPHTDHDHNHDHTCNGKKKDNDAPEKNDNKEWDSKAPAVLADSCPPPKFNPGKDGKESAPEPRQPALEPKQAAPEPKQAAPEPKQAEPEPKQAEPEPKQAEPEPKQAEPEPKQAEPEPKPAESEPNSQPSNDVIEQGQPPSKELKELLGSNDNDIRVVRGDDGTDYIYKKDSEGNWRQIGYFDNGRFIPTEQNADFLNFKTPPYDLDIRKEFPNAKGDVYVANDGSVYEHNDDGTWKYLGHYNESTTIFGTNYEVDERSSDPDAQK